MDTSIEFKSKTMPVLRMPSHSPSLNRRQPLLARSKSTPSPKGCTGVTVGEVCGGTTAGCAAICCLCPCGLVNLLVLAVYKLPAGLYRRALRNRRRQQLVKRGLLPQGSSRRLCGCGCDGTEVQIHPMGGSIDGSEEEWLDIKKVEPDEDAMALEKEMWNIFYHTGFWRSPSQRENVATPKAKSGLTRSTSKKNTVLSPNVIVTLKQLQNF